MTQLNNKTFLLHSRYSVFVTQKRLRMRFLQWLRFNRKSLSGDQYLLTAKRPHDCANNILIREELLSFNFTRFIDKILKNIL